MKKQYSIERLDKIIIVRFFGSPSFEDAKAAIHEVIEMPDNHLRLWNVSKATFEGSTQEIRDLAAFAREVLLFTSKMAIVSSHDLGFGLARVFEGSRGQENIDSQVFRHESDAIEWLLES